MAHGMLGQFLRHRLKGCEAVHLEPPSHNHGEFVCRDVRLRFEFNWNHNLFFLFAGTPALWAFPHVWSALDFYLPISKAFAAVFDGRFRDFYPP